MNLYFPLDPYQLVSENFVILVSCEYLEYLVSEFLNIRI